MENATIVKLGPTTKVIGVQSVSFEEAFGEHSNLAGKFRAKIATKRADNAEKISSAKKRTDAAKTSTKVAKQENKGTVKVAKKNKKSVKKVAGQQVKTNKMRAKQGRKTEAKGLRLERRAMGVEEPLPAEELAPDEEIYEEGNEGELEEEPTGEVEETESEDSVEEVEQEEEPAEEEEEYEESADGDGYYDNFESDLANFDGDETKLCAKDSYACGCGADGSEIRAKINPKILGVARKIEWNKEMVSRLDGSGENSVTVDGNEYTVDGCKERAIELESQMDAYIAGDESEASGAGREKRMAHVGAAMQEARKQRIGNRLNAIRAQKAKGKNVTEIEQGLNPQISPNKIEIPAVNNADGESSFDANESNATGTKATAFMKKINWIGVGAGAVIGVTVIILLNKFVFKKKK